MDMIYISSNLIVYFLYAERGHMGKMEKGT